MNRIALTTLVLLAALPGLAQQAAPTDESQKPVAVINGEVITKAKLDSLYANIPAQTRLQYEKTGGQKAYLDNYVAKRLMIQEALKTSYDQRPEVKLVTDAARESALFDRYIRDVVASNVITDDDIRKYYDEHMNDFRTPERVEVRHIVISWSSRTKEEARRRGEQVLAELMPYRMAPNANTDAGRQMISARFADAARRYSEDGVAQEGGYLGWSGRGQYDKNFEDAAFGMKAGTMSGIIETPFGYHLILVENKEDAGVVPFDIARTSVREILLGRKMTEIMAAVTRMTNELRQSSKIAIYPENIR